MTYNPSESSMGDHYPTKDVGQGMRKTGKVSSGAKSKALERKLNFKGHFEKGEREEASRAFSKSPKLRSFGFGGGKKRGEVTR
jgi:hypothetical protein